MIYGFILMATATLSPLMAQSEMDIVGFCVESRLVSPGRKLTLTIKISPVPKAECTCMGAFGSQCIHEITDQNGKLLHSESHGPAAWIFATRWLDDKHLEYYRGPMGRDGDAYDYYWQNPLEPAAELQILESNVAFCQYRKGCPEDGAGTLTYAGGSFYFLSDTRPNRLFIYRVNAPAKQDITLSVQNKDWTFLTEVKFKTYSVERNLTELRVQIDGRAFRLDNKTGKLRPR